jgi:transposase
MTDTFTTPSNDPTSALLMAEMEVLKAEIRDLKAENEALKAENRDLKAQLGQNSSNSSKPPSTDPPWKKHRLSKSPSGRKPGGQPGHPGYHRVVIPQEEVTETQQYLSLECGQCGHKLGEAPQPGDPPPRLHQVVELPEIRVKVIQYQAHGRVCPCCGAVTWGEIPSELRRYAFGPKLTALLVYLCGQCHLSKRVIQEVVKGLLGVEIALGSLPRKEKEVSEALKKPHEEAEEAVRQSAVKHADETGWEKRGKTIWLWVAATLTVAFFRVQERRNREAMETLLGKKLKGILVSDRYGAYGKIPIRQRQLCWAHLKRDFQKQVDRGSPEGEKVGKAGLKLVGKIFGCWHEFKEGKIGRKVLIRKMKPLRKRLLHILREGRAGPDSSTAQFCGRLLKLDEALWTFVRVPGVEPTNNHAERTLRPAVLWRKSSFGNNSEAGCRFTERILTVVQTLRLQKRNVLDYITQAVQAARLGLPSPKLV